MAVASRICTSRVNGSVGFFGGALAVFFVWAGLGLVALPKSAGDGGGKDVVEGGGATLWTVVGAGITVTTGLGEALRRRRVGVGDADGCSLRDGLGEALLGLGSGTIGEGVGDSDAAACTRAPVVGAAPAVAAAVSGTVMKAMPRATSAAVTRRPAMRRIVGLLGILTIATSSR